MRARRLISRVVPLGATAALVLSMAPGPVAHADPVVGSNGLSIEITGGPVYLQGKNGASCANTANANAPARLSGPLTIVLDSVPNYPGFIGQTRSATVGANAGFATSQPGGITPGASIVVPQDGNGLTGFTCMDAANGLLPVTVTTSGFVHSCFQPPVGQQICVDSPRTDSVSTQVTLSAVD